MTKVEQFPPRDVAVYLPAGSQLVGAIGLIEAFDAANRYRTHRGKAPLYRVRLLGDADRVQSATGLAVHTEPLDQAEPPHTLVVCGALAHTDRPLDPRALGSLAALAERAERLVTICAGTFWLGALGLLDGKRCTTHWMALDRLREQVPSAKVEPDAIFTEDGALFTSAGATAGLDLALHLVALDGGRRLSRAVARALVVFAQRPGGQSQFSEAVSVPAPTEERIRAAMHAVVRQPAEPHTVTDLARHAGMSERHFARVFRDQTGHTPAHFVTRVRVEAAQRLLLEGEPSLDWVADRCGFGTAGTLRRAFLRVAGVSPSAWRSRFR